MSVGDVTSTERGTGARFNDGKTMMEYQMLDQLPIIYDDQSSLRGFMFMLGEFQMNGDEDSLGKAASHLYGELHDRQAESDNHVLAPVMRVWAKGAEKYAMWNHAKGMPWSVPMACIARHYTDIVEKDQDIDPETGELHLASMMCNVQMLLNYIQNYPEGNDLPHAVNG